MSSAGGDAYTSTAQPRSTSSRESEITADSEPPMPRSLARGPHSQLPGCSAFSPE